MKDQEILALYQQVRNRSDFFNYWKASAEADQTLSSIDHFVKADKALNDHVIVAFARELALGWGAGS